HLEARGQQVAVYLDSQFRRLQGAGCGHHDNKFISAITETHVLLAAEFAYALPGPCQQFAADQVSVQIVHLLEPVKVEEGEAYGTPLPMATVELLTQHFVGMRHVIV